MVPERDHIDTRGEQLVGDLGGDPEPAGDVLAVDDDERRLVRLAQLRQQAQQRAAAQAAHEVSDEQDVGSGAHSGSVADSLPRVSAAEPSPLLRAVAVGKRFGAREALRGVSLEVAAGEVLAVIGPNGAGKTTLLEIVAGAQQPDTGSVEHPAGAVRVGWVPQQLALYGRLTVAENLRLFARLEGAADVEGAVASMLAASGLHDRAGDPVERLSGGNRQRVNVAIGLLGDPPVVLLDEPSASLDPRQRERLWDFTGALTERGTAVVFTTHNVGEAQRHADRLLVLADGEVLFTGTPGQLAERAGTGDGDLEDAVIRFLAEAGH